MPSRENMAPDCAICAMPRILMKCSACGRRTCGDCYANRHALCAACATQQGMKVPLRPHVF